MTEKTKNHSETKIIAIGLLLILLIGIYFFGQTWWRNKKADEKAYTALATEASLENYPTITPESLQKIIRSPEEKFTLIDIRPAAEYELSHIPNSLSYPDKALLAVNLKTIQKVIIVGDDINEGVNLSVAKFLDEQKIPYAFLKGGHTAWVALNEQVITTGDPNSFVDQSKVQYISPEDLKKRFIDGEKFFVLDVQPKEKFIQRHLRESVNIPLLELENRIGEIPTGKKIIVYGQNDTESFQAGITLFDLNIFSALAVSGNNVLAPESGLFTEGNGQ
jgi:rhodanese-related sulfurtransferase